MMLTRRQQARDGRESWAVFKRASRAALPASLNDTSSSPTVTALKDSRRQLEDAGHFGITRKVRNKKASH